MLDCATIQILRVIADSLVRGGATLCISNAEDVSLPIGVAYKTMLLRMYTIVEDQSSRTTFFRTTKIKWRSYNHKKTKKPLNQTGRYF